MKIQIINLGDVPCLVQLVKMLSYYWIHNNKLSFINTDNPSMFLTI
ncbi:MAG: hypothetical protein J5710_04550 [Treponema sp.]|nr:hypothetical protein [Treponema sp.]